MTQEITRREQIASHEERQSKLFWSMRIIVNTPLRRLWTDSATLRVWLDRAFSTTMYYVGPRAVIPDILNSSSRCFCCRICLRVCLVLLRVETYPLVEITVLREMIICCLLISYLCSSVAH